MEQQRPSEEAFTQGEAVEGQLNALIDLQYRNRVKKEGNGRPSEAEWARAVQQAAEERHEQRRRDWVSYHRSKATNIREVAERIAQEHEAKARALWRAGDG